MHMCIVDRPHGPGQKCLNGIPCDIVALLKRGCGEGLIQKQKASAGSFGEHLLKTDAFLPEPSQIHRLIFVRRKMCVYTVAGNIPEALSRNEEASLCQNKQLSHSLGDGGLSASVCTGEDIDGVLLIKGKVIGYDLADIFHVHGKLQIVEAFCGHGSLACIFGLCLAEHTSLFHQTADKLRTSDVIDKLRYQSGYIYNGHVRVPGKSVP